jgi:hypothetical protein
LGCGIIAKISLDIDDELFEDLRMHALKNEINYLDLIEKLIQDEINKLNEVNSMSMVHINDDVMEKVNIKCKLAGKTSNEVINDVLWDQLAKIEDVPDDFDAEKIRNKLEHDKPEGDDILDKITDLFD